MKLFTGFDLVYSCAIVVLAVIASVISVRGKTLSDELSGENRHTGYDHAIPTYWLVAYIGTFVVIAPVYMLIKKDISLVARAFFHVILVTAVYMILLTLFAPVLKKRLYATSCITLWLMPNVLYLLLIGNVYSNAPAVVIRIPALVLTVITVIWMIGFITTIARGFIEHHRFKKKIFEDARDVSQHVRQLYHQVREEMRIKGNRDGHPYYAAPLISPAINTPLAIGFLTESVRVILPDREYTDDELRLIFRHEWVHIVRKDSWTKLFLLIYRALCWFLPVAGKAVDCAAEDMELSCDEIVLRDQDDHTKREYGRLVLATAASASGFTTCLSASAASMKYRLQRILSDEKRRIGLPVIALACSLLVFGSRLVTFAVDHGTVAELLATEQIDLSADELAAVYEGDKTNRLTEFDAEELTEGLLEMRICRLGGRYAYESDGNTTILVFRDENSQKETLFTVTEHTVSMHTWNTKRADQTIYYRE